MKALVTPVTPRSLRRTHPLDDLVPGWFFRQEEVSAGCYITEGRDLYGRSVSSQSFDPQAALQECVAFARQAASGSSSVA